MKVLKRMQLINWSYIHYRLITFSEHVNFFTGHSGSGKSTVLDAMQVVLLGETNGKRIFNKAAKKESNRELIEYLRGMQTENIRKEYLRNSDFVSQIVLEFEDDQSHATFCLGIVFDVKVSNNEHDEDHCFFYYNHPLDDHYFSEKDGDKISPWSIKDFKAQAKSDGKLKLYYSNAQYREDFLNRYMGELNPKYFDLFKKAIAFSVDMKIDDFIRQFVCQADDLDLNKMLDTFRAYNKILRIIQTTKEEKALLEEIETTYQRYHENKQGIERYQTYQLLADQDKAYFQLSQQQDLLKSYQIDLEKIKVELEKIEEQRVVEKTTLDRLTQEYYQTGVKEKIQRIDNQIQSLHNQKQEIRFNATEYLEFYNHMIDFNDFGIVNPKLNHYLDLFLNRELLHQDYDAFVALLNEEIDKHMAFLDKQEKELRANKERLKEIEAEWIELEKGKKTYDPILLDLKEQLETLYFNLYHESLDSHFLADLIEINDPKWRNAIEGYLNRQKTYLVVIPEQYEKVEKAYSQLHHPKKHLLSLLNTQKMAETPYEGEMNSLAFTIDTNHVYVKNYIHFLMGQVMKCEKVEELKQYKIAITPDCHLYSGYVLSFINPRFYTQNALIGQQSLQIRMDALSKEKENLESTLVEQVEMIQELLGTKIKQMKLVIPSSDILEYQHIQKTMQDIEEQIRELNDHKQTILSEQEIDYETLIQKQEEKMTTLQLDRENLISKESIAKEGMGRTKEGIQHIEERLEEIKQSIVHTHYQEDYLVFIETQNNLDQAKRTISNQLASLDKKIQPLHLAYNKAKDMYHDHFKESPIDRYKEDNQEYHQRLVDIIESRLPDYEQQAKDRQQQTNIEFKEDFLYKIANRMDEAKKNIRDINKDIESISFGKDKYQFTAKRPLKSPFCDFYDMLIDPDFRNRDNLFGADFDDRYAGILSYMQETLEILNDPQAIDYQKRKDELQKLGDYRNYFEFGMIGRNENGIEEDLTKTQNKNSGGESQNPLYLALLTAFYQIFRMKSQDRQKNLPLKLIVLDEAFNKMDGNKVKSSVNLIHKLGLQAIIAAPDIHLENYVEVVEKVFEFENDNKQNIKIAEFEKGGPLWDSLFE